MDWQEFKNLPNSFGLMFGDRNYYHIVTEVQKNSLGEEYRVICPMSHFLQSDNLKKEKIDKTNCHLVERLKS